MIPAGPYLDMHTHILPGVDDGSDSMECTINMLKQAEAEGIKVIVATPHFGIRNAGLRVEDELNRLAAVRKAAEEYTDGVRLVLGNELYYSDGIVNSLKTGEAKTIADTSYALVEFSTHDSYDRICKCINELTWEGYRPIIAHLERYKCLEGDLEAVYNLVDQGAAVQINCRSFMDGAAQKEDSHEHHRSKGIFGRRNRSDQTGFFLERKGDWAREMLKAGLVHLIASDAHDDRFRNPVYRSALEAMERYCSEETLVNITKKNPYRLLKNEPIV